jgi:hypothetical protein
MGRFAVIDTETSWRDQVMSIGTVIADSGSFQLLDARYHVLPEEYAIGGMYENAVFMDTPMPPIQCSRADALRDIKGWLRSHGVTALFAYNACFDRNHLPELCTFAWHDIMRLAAYRQHNPCIPADAPCCATGRMKRGYGVEAMLRILSGNCTYRETHNAIFDAMDELEVMRLLAHPLDAYPPL